MRTNPNDSITPYQHDYDGADLQGFKVSSEGLTKREHFASMFLQTMMVHANGSTYEELAHYAVRQADALIEELNKNEEK